ncbi:MFS transporter [Lentisphaerota bacterium ZTH]|nr:MFS transporter [Lentisphaerota bacterium]WET07302.1 MFS transporter [Lentisphaerota bacterium ZTH]
MTQTPNYLETKKRSCRAVNWLNFFLADVRDGLGPFLAIFLLTTYKWDQARIGIILTVMGLSSLIIQIPAGAFIDYTKNKRLVLAVCILLISTITIVVVWVPVYSLVLSLKVIMGMATAFLGPAVAAITLGLTGPRYFTRLVGRNEAYNHAGNVFASLLTGVIGYCISMRFSFYTVGIMAALSLISLFFVKSDDIDNRLARGFTEEKCNDNKIPWYKVLTECPPLLIFTICIVLFHFANAAMLPMVGEKLTDTNPQLGPIFISSCIVTAQLAMIPMAILVGRKGDEWGRKKLFMLAFAILPVRGVLFAFTSNAVMLILIQVMDGIANGIFGALFLIIIADLTKSTGRFNVSQGVVTTIMGLGASMSNAVAGAIVVKTSYFHSFMFLAGIALLAFVIFTFFMPETKNYVFRPRQPQKQ